jgi:hypothetical protein
MDDFFYPPVILILFLCFSSLCKKKQLFQEFSSFCYISVSFVLTWKSGFSILDVMGLRPTTSQYLAMVASVILMSLLYLGNIITLASSEIKSRPKPSWIKESICKTLIFSNSAPLILVFNGWTLHLSIVFSAFFSGMLMKWDYDRVDRVLEKFFSGFIVSCLESYVFLMTGSTLALWFVSVTNCLLAYPHYLEGVKRNYLVEMVHLVSVLVFSAIFPIVLNPYHYSGVFYKIHTDFNFI